MGTQSERRILELVVVIVLVAITHATDPKQEETKDSTLQDPRARFLFGSYSTTTYTHVYASTSTVFFSCLSGTATGTVCRGRGARRAKRQNIKSLLLENDGKLPEVESSIDKGSAEEDEVANIGGEPRLAFTIWTTSRTTTSVTVFYTNTSTTIRLSYYCYAGGIRYPEFNCQIKAG